MNNRSDLENHLNSRASIDPEFRDFIKKNPKKAIKQELGISLPRNIKVEVIEETPEKYYFVLNAQENTETEISKVGFTNDIDTENNDKTKTEREEKEIAYARNESTSGDVIDKKTINIPDGWSYDGDWWRITTANPENGEGLRWWRSRGVTRNNSGRVESVWVEVKAGRKDTWGGNIWIGVELLVRMIRNTK